ncbi:MAG: hypothetical protein QX197_02785 [Methylococcaceae bacterium]
MNYLNLSSVFFLVLMTTSMASHAVDAPQPPQPATHGAGMTDEQREQHFRAKQEQDLIMHDLSNQILAEKDPAKKEQLKNQQLDLMKTHHAQMMEHHQGKMKNHP